MLGSWVETGDILVCKLTPQMVKESSYAPEDKLLRTIFGMRVYTSKETCRKLSIGGRGRVIDVRWVQSSKTDETEKTERATTGQFWREIDWYATSVIVIEPNAIFWAIQVTIAKGFRNVILETDSNILDDFLHNKELLQIRGLFLHIRRLYCSFTSCSWSFVRREGKRVAHELARMALYENVDEAYDGFVPP
uniref:DNA-directed RNA polymerase subunit beta, chloroplastic n=1 Tax=Tanacetum cinerariifolium TaxID=118510 RepID=A0A6L2J6G2_TANCI|nr:DNA-directed RNA polymerase subunit beta, chloroplastic [Tanacetum cinerariifolium]